ncbi:mechanosensitive ion channel protein 10-like [Dorcoceras hygrometricum]|uniref:Mechanosensitive ion channel protein 10-like n=1 Tax=Dorcoceras hygrometricum TaxID=472368 RepID=A0A2Z7CIC2_9LAMI|nr:mechanosensitive ion channel protein 10-like [Dorcoceras hygrometricum]
MGPISYIGPKTSRAARDRPELNPRRNEPSRHRRSITGRRPPPPSCAGRKAARCRAKRDAHSVQQPPRASLPQAAHHRASNNGQRLAVMHDQRGRDARPARISYATSGATPLNILAISAAPTAGQRATIVRPERVQDPPIVRPARDDVARDARRCARACGHVVGWVPPPMAAAGGQLQSFDFCF